MKKPKITIDLTEDMIKQAIVFWLGRSEDANMASYVWDISRVRLTVVPQTKGYGMNEYTVPLISAVAETELNPEEFSPKPG